MTSGRRAVREHGSALLVTLVVLVVCATATAIAAVALGIGLRSERDETRHLELVVLSDSALSEAMAELAEDPYAAGAAAHPFGRGEIASAAEPFDATSVRVRFAARVGGLERHAIARVEVGGTAPRVVAWRTVSTRPAAGPLTP